MHARVKNNDLPQLDIKSNNTLNIYTVFREVTLILNTNIGFSENELKVLDVAYETFLTKEYALRLFTERASDAGFESWVTNELLLACWIRGMEAKKRQDPDMEINDIRIQVKVDAHRNRITNALNADIEQHSDCDIHLIIGGYTKEEINRLEKFSKNKNVIYKEKILGNSNWLVLIAKPTKIVTP